MESVDDFRAASESLALAVEASGNAVYSTRWHSVSIPDSIDRVCVLARKWTVSHAWLELMRSSQEGTVPLLGKSYPSATEAGVAFCDRVLRGYWRATEGETPLVEPAIIGEARQTLRGLAELAKWVKYSKPGAWYRNPDDEGPDFLNTLYAIREHFVNVGILGSDEYSGRLTIDVSELTARMRSEAAQAIRQARTFGDSSPKPRPTESQAKAMATRVQDLRIAWPARPESPDSLPTNPGHDIESLWNDMLAQGFSPAAKDFSRVEDRYVRGAIIGGRLAWERGDPDWRTEYTRALTLGASREAYRELLDTAERTIAPFLPSAAQDWQATQASKLEDGSDPTPLESEASLDSQGWSREMTKTEAGRLLGCDGDDRTCRDHLGIAARRQ